MAAASVEAEAPISSAGPATCRAAATERSSAPRWTPSAPAFVAQLDDLGAALQRAADRGFEAMRRVVGRDGIEPRVPEQPAAVVDRLVHSPSNAGLLSSGRGSFALECAFRAPFQ